MSVASLSRTSSSSSLDQITASSSHQESRSTTQQQDGAMGAAQEAGINVSFRNPILKDVKFAGDYSKLSKDVKEKIEGLITAMQEEFASNGGITPCNVNIKCGPPVQVEIEMTDPLGHTGQSSSQRYGKIFRSDLWKDISQGHYNWGLTDEPKGKPNHALTLNFENGFEGIGKFLEEMELRHQNRPAPSTQPNQTAIPPSTTMPPQQTTATCTTAN